MEEQTKTISKSKYGILGLDVGNVGRWFRLFLGIIYLIPVILSIVTDPKSLSIFTQTIEISTNVLSFYLELLMYFVIIVVSYIVVYRLLGNKIFSKNNAWINTLIFVGPPIFIGYWNIFFGSLTNFKISLPLVAATTIYIALSLILEWRLKYGGCEVVSLPILLFKKRYKTYCIPIVVIDAVEKSITDKINNNN